MRRQLLLLMLGGLFSLATSWAQSLWPVPTPPQREIRAVWLTTIGGLDWPSRYARTKVEIERQKQELRDILSTLQQANINTILLQTRIRSTVIYPSSIEPWDGCMSGRPGVSPGYDPLAFAIEECHNRNMELHAWVVCMPICSVSQERVLGAKALPRRFPELCRKAGRNWMMDPGVPATADYLTNLCLEITRNYDIDGLHLDYIRYPEKEIPFNDNTTFSRYGNGTNRKKWQRENITRCVKKIYSSIKEEKPWIKVSCATLGKFSDLPRASSFGWNAYETVSQDAQNWLKNGFMDILFPMMYFEGNHFYPFLADWKENCHGRMIVPGLGAYFLAPKEKNWPQDVITREFCVIRQLGFSGHAFFRSHFLTSDTKGLLSFLQDFGYSSPILPPALHWVDSIPPTPPSHVMARQEKDGTLHLSWQASFDPTPGDRLRYNLYVVHGFLHKDFKNQWRLLSTKIQATHYEIFNPPFIFHPSKYAVTAIDRFGNESEMTIFKPVESEKEKSRVLSDKMQNSLLQLPN